MLQPARTVRLQSLVVQGTLIATPPLLFLFATLTHSSGSLSFLFLLSGLLSTFVSLRFYDIALVGPLFTWDLVQLARRGRNLMVRFVYLIALFLGLAAVYRGYFRPASLEEFLFGSGEGASIPDQAHFAERFTMVFLMMQTIAVLVLTPIYLGTIINEERARGAIDLLLTTQLSLREIAVGRLLARAAHLGGVLLTGLPVLALVMLWGGVDLGLVLAAFATTAITALSAGSLSLACSSATRRPSEALVGSYGLLLALSGVPDQLGGLDLYAVSPVFILIAMPLQAAQAAGGVLTAPTLPEMVAHFGLFHGLLIVLCLAITIARLRRPPQARIPRRSSVLGEAPSLPTGRAPVAPLVVSPPIEGDAFFWKEVLHNSGSEERHLAPTRMFYKIFFLILCPLVVVTRYLAWAWPDVWPTYANGLSLILRLLGTAWGLLACAVIGLRAANCLSGEQERRTLEGLLILPRDPLELLRAKAWGCVLRVRHAAYALAALWIMGLLTGSLHPIALPLLTIAVVAFAFFLSGLGLWLSSISQTSLRAGVSLMLVVLAVVFGPLLGYLFLGGSTRWVTLTPPASWWTLAYTWQDMERAEVRPELFVARRLIPPLIGSVVLGVAGVFLLVLARGRFLKRVPLTMQKKAPDPAN